MLIMQIRTSHNQVLILVLLFVAAVQTRQVIRAAPGIETTGQYMVALTPDTSHERFEAIAENVRSQSLSSEIHKIESQFAKVIVAKMSLDEAHKVSLKHKLYVSGLYYGIEVCLYTLKPVNHEVLNDIIEYYKLQFYN